MNTIHKGYWTLLNRNIAQTNTVSMYTTTTRTLIGYRSLQLCVLWGFEFSSGRIVGHLDFMLVMRPPFTIVLFVFCFLRAHFPSFLQLLWNVIHHVYAITGWNCYVNSVTGPKSQWNFRYLVKMFLFRLLWCDCTRSLIPWNEAATFVAFILFVFAICRVTNHTIWFNISVHWIVSQSMTKYYCERSDSAHTLT